MSENQAEKNPYYTCVANDVSIHSFHSHCISIYIFIVFMDVLDFRDAHNQR